MKNLSFSMISGPENTHFVRATLEHTVAEHTSIQVQMNFQNLPGNDTLNAVQIQIAGLAIAELQSLVQILQARIPQAHV